jgi:hypothetical protein
MKKDMVLEPLPNRDIVRDLVVEPVRGQAGQKRRILR